MTFELSEANNKLPPAAQSISTRVAQKEDGILNSFSEAYKADELFECV